MVTLKEFVLNLNKDTQFRVYLPNRDCLIYESFHSPHVTEPGILSSIWDEDTYYINRKNQQYCPVNLRLNLNILDYETKIFLEKFGDYEIHSIECSSCFKDYFIYNEELDRWEIKHFEDSPNNIEACFDLFIKYN